MKSIKQFILYLFVGAVSTVVEWICFYFFNQPLHYSLATALAFVFSTLTNWFVGRLILFKKNDAPLWKELAQIYGTSIVGLVLNLLIMFVFIERFKLMEMLSKIIATGIVFLWNFFVRKLLIYKV